MFREDSTSKYLRTGAYALAGQSPEKRRSETHFPAAGSERLVAPWYRRYGTFVSNFRFTDIFSAYHHTNDFKLNRAENINIRLRFMAIFFALVVPAYMLIDYYTLTHAHFIPIASLRCVLALIHITVCLFTLRRLSPLAVNALLGLDILAAGLFYMAAMYILQSGIGEVPPVGYTFMPLMMIVMLGLFPLTLSCSLLIMLLVVECYAGLQIMLGNLLSEESLSMLFLFLLFMGIILWLQSGQLLMLLRLYRESTRDALTGLINRRVLMKFLDQEVNQNQDTERRFSVLMMDLDRFKLINDDHGHFTGDLVIKATARLLETEMRVGDIVARFGGEEFVAVLPGLGRDMAVAVAERICESCTQNHITAPDGSQITFTASIGVSEYIGGEDIETTLRRADEALYSAKEQGRNRVICEPA